jgi:hypothetical protein
VFEGPGSTRSKSRNDRELKLARPHHLRQHRAIRLDQPHPHIRVRGQEAAQRRGQRAARHRRHQPDRDLALEPRRETLHPLRGLVLRAQHGQALPVIIVPCGRRLDPAALPQEQFEREPVLELADMLRHARLRRLLAARRGGEGALLIGGDENPDVAQRLRHADKTK